MKIMESKPVRPSPEPFTTKARLRLTLTGGFTLVELMIVIAILGTLVALAVPTFFTYVHRTRIANCIQDIRVIQNDIIAFEVENNRLPIDLNEVDRGQMRDPWNNPYQYTNFETTPKGKWRKDKFLVPLNSSFDLWSMGPDGKSQAPLTAKASKDDILRANDGNFIGVAQYY